MVIILVSTRVIVCRVLQWHGRQHAVHVCNAAAQAQAHARIFDRGRRGDRVFAGTYSAPSFPKS